MNYNTDGFQERLNYIKTSNELNKKKRSVSESKQTSLMYQNSKREELDNIINFERSNYNNNLVNELRHSSNNSHMMNNNFRG